MVASETVEHDCIYRFVKRPPPRFAGDKILIDQFEELSKASPDFKIYIGIMASGDEDIVERSKAEEIHRRTGAMRSRGREQEELEQAGLVGYHI